MLKQSDKPFQIDSRPKDDVDEKVALLFQMGHEHLGDKN
jgi:hypothetical protein